jgi:hypothetical protein
VAARRTVTPTNPDGTRPPGTPAWWPFGTTRPTDPIPPVDVRIRVPRAPRAPREPLPIEPAPY